MKLRRWLAVIGLLVFIPAQALALTDAERKAVNYDAVYYDPSGGNAFCVGGPGGSGPLYGPRFPQIPDTAALAKNIDDFINNTQPDSPMKGFGNAFVSLGQKYNVNPAFAVAQGYHETQLGTTGVGKPPQYDIFGVRNNGSAFGGYANPTDALDHYYQLISSGTYLSPPAGLTTIQQVIATYAPPADGNDDAAYFAHVNSVMQKILGGLTTGNPTDTAALTAGCGSNIQTTSAGALGWDLSGPHAMVNYNQGDPRWANDPYGEGKSSIGSSGCGPTSIAMVVATLTGNSSITPLTIANQYGGRFHDPGDGTAWAVFPVVGQDYHLQYQNLGTNLAGVAAIIKAGGLVIISVGPGYFTANGHLMVIRAVSADGTQFYLADPNGTGRHGDSETRAFSASFLTGPGHLRNLFAYTK